MSTKYTSQLVNDKIVTEEITIKNINDKTEIMTESLFINPVGESAENISVGNKINACPEEHFINPVLEEIGFKTITNKTGVLPEELLINVVGEEIVQQ